MSQTMLSFRLALCFLCGRIAWELDYPKNPISCYTCHPPQQLLDFLALKASFHVAIAYHEVPYYSAHIPSQIY